MHEAPYVAVVGWIKLHPYILAALSVEAVACMILRDLGKTGLRVGEIGLGTEHLGRMSKAKAVIVAVVDKAVKNGVNYFDLIFNFREYLARAQSRSSGQLYLATISWLIIFSLCSFRLPSLF